MNSMEFFGFFMYFFGFNSFKKGKTGCLCRAEPADMWRGHVSPRGRLLDAYVECTITGWQLMGPRVSGPRPTGQSIGAYLAQEGDSPLEEVVRYILAYFH